MGAGTDAGAAAALEEWQSFLLEASAVLAGAADYAETLNRLAEVAVPTLADLCLIDVLDGDGVLTRMAARHADPASAAMVEELHRRYPPESDGPHPVVSVLRDGRSRWSEHMTDDLLRATTRDEGHFALVKALGFSSYVTVPLIAERQVHGAVTLVIAGSDRRFGPVERSLAEEFAQRVAQVVAKASRYDEEHRLAHALQAALLPAALPRLPGIEAAARYQAGTRGADVGGDFYDMLVLPSGRLGLAVGDVAGHDLAAASMMGRLRSAARALSGQAHGPSELLSLLQWSWPLLGLERMATAMVARLDPTSGALAIASAGHPPPLVVADGRAEYLPVQAASPLGAPPTVAAEWAGVLDAGVALVFFTDGLVESRTLSLTDGLHKLADVAAMGANDPDSLCDRLLSAVVGTADRTDDVALLVIRRT